MCTTRERSAQTALHRAGCSPAASEAKVLDAVARGVHDLKAALDPAPRAVHEKPASTAGRPHCDARHHASACVASSSSSLRSARVALGAAAATWRCMRAPSRLMTAAGACARPSRASRSSCTCGLALDGERRGAAPGQRLESVPNGRLREYLASSCCDRQRADDSMRLTVGDTRRSQMAHQFIRKRRTDCACSAHASTRSTNARSTPRRANKTPTRASDANGALTVLRARPKRTHKHTDSSER